MDLFSQTIPETEGTRDCWATPREFFDSLNAEFHFTLDPCAEAWSAKCLAYYTRREDGLIQPWTGRVFLNPPYSNVGPWLKKAVAEVASGMVGLVVALVPSATDTAWWQDHVEACADEIRFPRGRIQFVPPPGIKASSNDTPSAVVVFGRLPAGERCSPAAWRRVPVRIARDARQPGLFSTGG